MHFKLAVLSQFTMKLHHRCMKNAFVCSGADLEKVIDVKLLAVLSPPASDSLEGLLNIFKISL